MLLAVGHYADIKYGQLAGQNGVADVLRVITGGKTIWSVTPVKGTWVSQTAHHYGIVIPSCLCSIILFSKRGRPAGCGCLPAVVH
jgi:hypothetical protein